MNFKRSVSRLREELDRCDIIKQEEVQKAVASHQREITHFKRMVSALREELDHKDILQENKIQEQNQIKVTEFKQLQQTIIELRSELENKMEDNKEKFNQIQVQENS